MGIAVDGVILLILVICMITGYKRGLSGSLFKMLAFLLTIVLTIVLYKPVSNLVMEKTQINEGIENYILRRSGDKEAEKPKQQLGKYLSDSENVKITESDGQEDLEKNKNDEEVKNEQSKDGGLLNTASEKIKNGVEEAKKTVTTEITSKAVSIIVAIVLFIVIRFLLFIVELILSVVTDLPVIGQIDEVGGLIYGIIHGLIIVYIVIMAVSLANVFDPIKELENAIKESFLGSILYNHNVIVMILEKLNILIK